jgi:hypothetical protein
MSNKDMLGQIVRAATSVPLEHHGVALDLFNRLQPQQDPRWAAHLKQVIRAGLPGTPGEAASEFSAIVNFDETLPEMIAAGQFDWTNGDITPERFPVRGNGQKKYAFKLYEPKRTLSSEAVIALMEADGFPAASHEAGLAFARDFPKEQLKRPIATLGSSAEVDGHRYVLCLHRNGAERFLFLSIWANDWSGRWGFLGAREVSAA